MRPPLHPTSSNKKISLHKCNILGSDFYFCWTPSGPRPPAGRGRSPAMDSCFISSSKAEPFPSCFSLPLSLLLFPSPFPLAFPFPFPSCFSLPLSLLLFPSPLPSSLSFPFPLVVPFLVSLVLSLSRSSPLFHFQVLSCVYLLVSIRLVSSVLLLSVPPEKLNPKPGSLNSN
jgi:hypothetical protein